VLVKTLDYLFVDDKAGKEPQRGWTVVDMKTDWRHVLAFGE
jgi:hypothetical protein